MRALKSGIVLIACFLCFFFSVNVFAEDACNIAGVKDTLICGTEGGDEEVELMGRISNVLNVVYLWIGIITVIFIVIGGSYYITNRNFKRSVPIDDSKSMLGFTDWVAERYRNLKKQ